jgi:hypothetical protein
MTFHANRAIACLMTCGLLLAACGSTVAKVPSDQRELEATACKLIGPTPAPPPPDSNSFEAISVQTSTLRALEKTDDASLKAVVLAYEKAATAQNNGAMIRALNDGVSVCHGLGLQTGT